MNYILFMTSVCPKCPPIKDFMAKQEMEGVSYVADKDSKGMHEARKYGVSAVPTVIFLENGAEKGRAGSVKEIEKFITG